MASQKKPAQDLSISDLASMAHALDKKAGDLPYLCFGGFSDTGKRGEGALRTLRSIERDITKLRTAIHTVVRNEKREADAEARAEFNALAKSLGKRVRA